MKIKDLPNLEKPRERLLKYGANNLTNEELISIILRAGTKNSNVKILSNEVLSKSKSINNLKDITIKELCSIKGIGKVKAVTLLAAIELGKRVYTKEIDDKLILNNSSLVHKYFSSLIGHQKQEEVLVILLDNKKRLITYKKMYKGTKSSSLASAKEIYNYAIKEDADAVILMHNHPSGILIPSDEDIKLTNNLINTGKIVGIPLIDHLITNGINYYSFFNNEKSL